MELQRTAAAGVDEIPMSRAAGTRGDGIPTGLDGLKPKSSGGGVPAGRQGRRRAPHRDQAVREAFSTPAVAC
jgi:hypothetical protein